MDSDDPAQSTIDPALLAKLPPELNNAIKTFTFLAQMQDAHRPTLKQLQNMSATIEALT